MPSGESITASLTGDNCQEDGHIDEDFGAQHGREPLF